MIKDFNKALKMMEDVFKRELTKEERASLRRAYLEGYDMAEKLEPQEVRADSNNGDNL